MVIWINGAYGSGKSTTVERIQELFPDTLMFDAEEVGNAVRDNMKPVDYHVEFPDYAIWREFVVRLVVEMKKHTDKSILIPMTVLKEEYMQEMRLAFEHSGLIFCHFILDVDGEQIGKRIILRGEETDCWCYKQIERCAELLPKLSGIHIDGTKSIEEVVEAILTLSKSN